MRIGLLASVGGMLDSFFPEIIDVWQRGGHTVCLAAGTPTDGPLSATVIGGLGRRPGPGMLGALGRLRGWAREKRLDVVVTNSATASALVRAALLPIPVIYFCHGLHWNTGSGAGERLWMTIESALLRRTAGAITINGDDQTWFRSHGVGSDRLVRLRSGVGLDLDAYPALPLQPQTAESRISDPPAEAAPAAHDSDRRGPDRPRAQRLALAWVGEFSARKRPEKALDVAARLVARGIDLSLTMLGEGDDLERVRQRIQALGLGAHVDAPGSGPAAQILADSHALLHTATWEGLPRVMLEALAVGRRTYAFDVKGVRDIPNADLVADGDAGALAELIAADHRTGRLRTPVDFARSALDSRHAAETVLVFLERIVDAGTPVAVEGAQP